MTPDPVRQARIELAAAYRVAALEGLDDGVFNHFSMAVPGRPGQFLIKPWGPLFSEVTASSLIIVALDGTLVEGEGEWEPTAFYIHSRIYAAVPRARCVLHTHMPYANALSSQRDMRFQPVNQSTMRFIRRTGYIEDYNGLALDTAEGDRIAATLRDHDLLLMANHGVMVIGPSIQHAIYDLHYFEIACRDQHLVMSWAGQGGPRLIPESIVDKTARQMLDEREMGCRPHFAAMCRQLDATDPTYRD